MTRRRFTAPVGRVMRRTGPGKASLSLVALLTGLGLGLWASGASSATTLASAITGGQTLTSGQELESADGHYVLQMQSTGNLAEVMPSGGRTVWQSGTSGHPGDDAVLEPDGALVVDARNGQPVWSDDATIAGCPALNVLDDGSVEVDGPSASAWSTGAVSEMVGGDELMPGQVIVATNRRYDLVMQGDGNLVEYNSSGTPLWASGTSGDPGNFAVLQGGGNLVLYTRVGTVLWFTHTSGHPGAVLRVQGSGAVVLDDAGGSTVWSTGTSGASPGAGHIAPAAQRGASTPCPAR